VNEPVMPPSDQQTTAPHDAAVARVEILISNLLRIGVISSLLIIILGTTVTFIRHPEYLRDATELQRLTSSGAAFPHTMRNVFRGLLAFQGQSIVMLGLVVLIATPVVRVGVSIAAFLYQRDRVFVVITTVVFLLLITSFFLGKVEG
jgi:uncharacterized membrane protein